MIEVAKILWMEEILHHLGWLKPYKGINHLSTGAGFHNHPQYHKYEIS
jgi:hypothetical protein